MARLKSVKFKLKFNISYSTHPITITHNGLTVDQVDLQVSSLYQKETFEFRGYSPKDPKQKVTYTLEYNQKELDIQNLTSFEMQNNKFVENQTIENCYEILFNGNLNTQFNKAWFQRYLLNGANIDDGYVNEKRPVFNDETIFCVGDSRTYGEGVQEDETWPSMLDGEVFNFGTRGLSHDGCLTNVKYILEHSQSVKQIICLLPAPTRKLLEFEFLGCHGAISISYLDDKKEHLPSEFADAIQDTRNFIFSDDIKEHWIRNCLDIIDVCNKKKVDCWVSTWDHDMHEHIPEENRLPVFPKYETFKERASDGLHPHRKHYELFVKNIKPYIDKTQS